MKLFKVFAPMAILFIGIASACSNNSDNDGVNETLDSPKNVSVVELGKTSVTIKWDIVNEATKYRWYISPGGMMASASYFNEGYCLNTEITIDSLTTGTNFKFSVCAINENVEVPKELDAGGSGSPYYLHSDQTSIYFTTLKSNSGEE